MTGDAVPVLLLDAPVPGFAELFDVVGHDGRRSLVRPAANGLDPRAVQVLAVLRVSDGLAKRVPYVRLQEACSWLVTADVADVHRWLAGEHAVTVGGCRLVQAPSAVRRCEVHGLDAATGAVSAVLAPEVRCLVTSRARWSYDRAVGDVVELADVLVGALETSCRLAEHGVDAVGWDAMAEGRGRLPRPVRFQGRDRGVHWYARWKLGMHHPESLFECVLCSAKDTPETAPTCRTCRRELPELEQALRGSGSRQLAALPLVLSVADRYARAGARVGDLPARAPAGADG